MILLMFAALCGGAATALLVAPHGALWAVVAAPCGAGLCTFLAALSIAHRRGAEWQAPVDLDQQTDAMVTALRGLAMQAKPVSAAEKGPRRDVDVVRVA